MKTLKENATWREAMAHALKHAGTKVVRDADSAECWIDDNGRVKTAGDSVANSFAVKYGPFILLDPAPADPLPELSERLNDIFDTCRTTREGVLNTFDLLLAECRKICREVADERIEAATITNQHLDRIHMLKRGDA